MEALKLKIYSKLSYRLHSYTLPSPLEPLYVVQQVGGNGYDSKFSVKGRPTVIVIELSSPSPQSLCPFTFIIPDVKVLSKLIKIILDVLLPVAPEGNVQLYDVAPSISETEYCTFDAHLLTVVLPIKVPDNFGI